MDGQYSALLQGKNWIFGIKSAYKMNLETKYIQYRDLVIKTKTIKKLFFMSFLKNRLLIVFQEKFKIFQDLEIDNLFLGAIAVNVILTWKSFIFFW